MPRGTTTATCKNCFREFVLPLSRLWRNKFCSPKCGQDFQLAKKLEKKQNCLTCGVEFFPRLQQLKIGHGKYCSQKCNTAGVQALLKEETVKKAKETFKQRFKEGKINLPKGPLNWKWKGGPKAYRKRAQESGKLAERLREYRKANPEKITEWSNNRRSSKIGRIVRGTVKKLLELQKGLCAYCGISIPPYHLDHKLPIARGGTNATENLHLTCPKCNLVKNAMTHEEFLVSKKRKSRQM